MADKWKNSDTTIRVECETCGFARVVKPGDEEPAAKVLVKHGRRTGHRLSAREFDDREQ
jgi:hypothetical protein